VRVLLHNSHVQTGRANGWSGAPGEADWVMALNDRIETNLKSKGVEVVRVDGDLQDHPAFHSDYDAFVAPHYEADLHGTGGRFWGRAAASLTAALDDKLGTAFWTRYSALQGVPPEHFEWSNPNVTDYYGFRLTSAKTPGVLVEHGVGWGADKAWLRDNIDAIAGVWVSALLDFGGVAPAPAATVPVLGATRAFTASETDWSTLYRTLAPQAGVDGAVAYAQALHETGNFAFAGTAKPEWNNPAGIGVTGAPDIGNRFTTKEEGVRAHLGHLLWYFGPTHPVLGFCEKDPRHFGAHHNLPNDIRVLGGNDSQGRIKWAPGLGYGDAVVKILQAITTSGGETVDDTEFKEKYTRLIGPGLEAEIQQRGKEAVAEALKEAAARLAS